MNTEYLDETAAPVQPQIESIWLTRTSVKPIWLAISMLLTLVGLFAFMPLMVLAGIATIWISLSWISEARRESDELPRD